MTATFHGVVPPLLTPRSEDGTVDTHAMTALIEHLLNGTGHDGHGVHGIFVLGSSGEAPYLTADERDLVLSHTLQTVDGRVPVLVGLNEMTTERVLAEGRRLLAIGGDAVVATVPFYALGNEDEMRTHFRALTQLGVPVFAYDIPVRTHQKLPRDVALELLAEGTLAGIKDSSNDDVAFRQLLVRLREAGGHSAEAAIFTGHEVVVDGALLGGAHGVVPGLGNVDPSGYVRLWEAAHDGRWADAVREQDRLVRLFKIVEAATPGRVSGGAAGLGGFKTALTLMGVIASNRMSVPMNALDDDETETVRQILREEGLL